MSSNLTQMPVQEEFVRVYITGSSEEKIQDVSLYPLKPFRVVSEAFHTIMRQAIGETNKNYDEDRVGDANIELNYRINAGIARLDSEGKVICGERLEGVICNELQNVFNGNAVVQSCDGYAIFNPGVIPPTPSASTH